MKDETDVTGERSILRVTSVTGCYCLRCIPDTVFTTSRIQQVVNIEETLEFRCGIPGTPGLCPDRRVFLFSVMVFFLTGVSSFFSGVSFFLVSFLFLFKSTDIGG